MIRLFTPKQVARAIGVSESSLKRWCDRGLLPVIHTAGGHRRLPAQGVLTFLQQSSRTIVAPELLGLPNTLGKLNTAKVCTAEIMAVSLKAGDEQQCRQIVFDLYLNRTSVAEICDRVITDAFSRIGDAWQCGTLDVYQERRAVTLCMRVLAELRSLLPPPAHDAPVAVGAAIEGDHYLLPTIMVDLVLRALGWQAGSLGTNLPLLSIADAANSLLPDIVWLSVSNINDEAKFDDDYHAFLKRLPAQQSVMVGGRALVPEVRRRLTFSFYGDNMRHLETFAASIALRKLAKSAVNHLPT